MSLRIEGGQSPIHSAFQIFFLEQVSLAAVIGIPGHLGWLP